MKDPLAEGLLSILFTPVSLVPINIAWYVVFFEWMDAFSQLFCFLKNPNIFLSILLYNCFNYFFIYIYIYICTHSLIVFLKCIPLSYNILVYIWKQQFPFLQFVYEKNIKNGLSLTATLWRKCNHVRILTCHVFFHWYSSLALLTS